MLNVQLDKNHFIRYSIYTKPIPQIIGLEFSLSYDIIKAQGGELKMETKPGEGSEFIIHLKTT